MDPFFNLLIVHFILKKMLKVKIEYIISKFLSMCSEKIEKEFVNWGKMGIQFFHPQKKPYFSLQWILTQQKCKKEFEN